MLKWFRNCHRKIGYGIQRLWSKILLESNSSLTDLSKDNNRRDFMIPSRLQCCLNLTPMTHPCCFRSGHPWNWWWNTFARCQKDLDFAAACCKEGKFVRCDMCSRWSTEVMACIGCEAAFYFSVMLEQKRHVVESIVQRIWQKTTAHWIF